MADPSRPTAAGLSLDLDNRWTYLRSHGDSSWQQYPSFIATVVPRILDVFAELDLTATVFVIGRDAASDGHQQSLSALCKAGHELGNHSFDHAADFAQRSEAALQLDFESSEAALSAFGPRPVGFRAPSFGLSPAAVNVIAAREYHYDSSLWPTSVGPLARAWERLHFSRSAAANEHKTYGGIKSALAPQQPFLWESASQSLLELPVSTLPACRLPVHWTYLNFLADRSPWIARRYLKAHLNVSRHMRLPLQLLLHSTDFLGSDDPLAPKFMPGMKRTAAEKIRFAIDTLALYQQHFELLPLGQFASTRVAPATLRMLKPDRVLS